MLDILTYITSALDEPSIVSGKMGVEELVSKDRFQTETVKDVLNVSTKNEWNTMTEEDSIFDAIIKFAKRNIHGAAIVNNLGEFESILTQYRFIQWLDNHSNEIGDLANMTVEQFQFGYKTVHRMHQSRRAIDIFLQMKNLGVNALAIVNDESKLVGNISVSDLKDIGGSAQNFITLWTDATTFINSREYGANVPKLVYVTPNSTIKEVLSQLHTYGIHRVYVAENNTRLPIGIISCTDIIAFLGAALQGAATSDVGAAKKEPIKV